MIELERVTKVYRTGSIAVAALRGVSLSISEGEYVAVIGPSGSGKSTLMHILGCLDTPTSGAYHLAGDDVSSMSEAALAEVRNRRIGFVFQQFNLLASMSAWQNVELPLVYAGVPRAERKERAMDALARVGLAGRVNHRPGELSGGQQQRVAVARALVTEPDLILADEPTGNLDSVSAADVLRLMDELHESGRTLVLITHDAEVASASGRVVGHPRRPLDRERRALSWRASGELARDVPDRASTECAATGCARRSPCWASSSASPRSFSPSGLGEGAQGQVTSEITALGSNVLTITPGSSTSSTGIRQALGTASTLTVSDVAALSNPTVAPDVKAVAPITSSSETLTAGSSTWTTSVQGSTPTWLTVRGRTVAQGRFIDNQDVTDHGAVAVLGATTASELFRGVDPVGQAVDVNGVPLTVVGVLTSTGSSSSSSTTQPRRPGGHPDLHGRRAHLRRDDAQLREHHRRTGPLRGRSDRCLPGGRPPPPAAPRDHDSDQCGLHDHLGAVTDLDRHLGRPDADHPPRRRRRHLAPGGRDRRHEHHAGLGDRAHP